MEFSKNTRLWDILFRHLTAMGVSGKSLLTQDNIGSGLSLMKNPV
jgi:hypothetical protein